MTGPAPSFPFLSEPVRLRHRTLSGRITFGAHTANMAVDGLPGPRHRGYYAERARGGAAMIVVEPVPVHRTAVLTRGNFRAQDDTVIPAFTELVRQCRDAAPEVVLIQQLYHVGQHGDSDNSCTPHWSPSGLVSYHDADGSHAMTAAEVEELIEAFARAAERARAAGFDGVEVFAAYHSLIDQFWTPWSNRRTDRWGGSFENRVRFGAEVLGAIRARCGEDFIIGMAVSAGLDAGADTDDGTDTATGPLLSIAELAEVVRWHDERRLMDYVSCGTGHYLDFAAIIPPSLLGQRLGEPFSGELKKVVTHALVQCESHVRTPQAAEQVLAAGHADLVSIVRGQIADPSLVAKARAGRADDIRPCISCNQLCWGRRSRDYWISCLVNPSTGREFAGDGDHPRPASRQRRVLVVGAGPAGLETARVAALRGHRVTLVEAGPRLGGQFRLAGHQPSRGQILDLLGWYERQLTGAGVDLRLNTVLDAGTLRELADRLAVEAVVLATGSAPPRTAFQRALPLVARMPGAELDSVLAVQDVLDHGPFGPGTDPGHRLGEQVLLLDDVGDWRGLGTAVLIAEAGHRVCLVTPAAVAGPALAASAVDGLLRGRFARAGGEVLTSSAITAWHGDRAEVRCLLTGRSSVRAADTLVVAETAVARTGLADALLGEPGERGGVGGLGEPGERGERPEVHLVGDCVAPRRAWMAFLEGRELATRL